MEHQKKKKDLKKAKRNTHIIYCLSFFIILIVMGILVLALPKKAVSETENRKLAEMPEINAQNIENRSYMNGMETYLSDHFPARDVWVKAKTSFEMLFGRYERNGVYILQNRLVEKLDEPDYKSIDISMAAINNFAANSEVPVFLMIVPTSAGIYADELPKNAPSLNQMDFIQYAYNKTSDDIVVLNAHKILASNKDNYIYYRTDHHWTTFGAYKVYAAAGKKMGYSPIELNSYDIEHTTREFKGTYNSKTLYDKIDADVLDIYHYNNLSDDIKLSVTTEIGKEPEVYDSIYFREYLDTKDKYSVFLGTNQPMETINTGNEGGKILIIKDSYAHCYAPFLIPHYSEITLLDLRYIQTSIEDYVDINDYDQILILYNVSTFSSDINLRKLDNVQ